MSTNYIDQITDTAGTTHDISEGDSTRIFRAKCSTAAGTAAKVATLDTSNRNFSLTAGVRVAVTFTYGNSAATPTLRVDGSSTGTAKTIATPTAVATLTTGNGTTYNTWGPYETVIFTYNGTYWVKSGSSLGAYTGQPISIATSTGTNQITLNHGTKYSLNVGGNSYIFTTPTDNNSGGTITEVKTSEGAHTTIDVTSGKAEFNVPTKTSHLTNDSGFITIDSDENVKSNTVTTERTYYLTGSSSSSTVTGELYKHASIKAYVTSDSSTSGSAYISIGNSTASGTAGAKYGYLRLYGSTAYYHELKGVQSYPSANRSVYFPRYAGDMYLTCVPGVVAVGGATTAPVYVKSTGEIAAVTSIPYTLLSGTPTVTEVEIVRW